MRDLARDRDKQRKPKKRHFSSSGKRKKKRKSEKSSTIGKAKWRGRFLISLFWNDVSNNCRAVSVFYRTLLLRSTHQFPFGLARMTKENCFQSKDERTLQFSFLSASPMYISLLCLTSILPAHSTLTSLCVINIVWFVVFSVLCF